MKRDNMINKSNKWGLTVRGILEGEENKILLIKRHSKSRNEGQKWEFPGGKVDEGEFFEEALIREFKEETNLDVDIEGLHTSVEDSSITSKDEIIRTVQVIMKVSAKSEEISNLKISFEHEDYKWLDSEEIKKFYNEDKLTSTTKKAFKNRINNF